MKPLKQYIFISVLSVFFLGMGSCKNSTDSNSSYNSKTDTLSEEKGQETNTKLAQKKSLPEKSKSEPNLQIPNGYKLFDKIQGDLNGDGLDDYILVIKETNKEMIIQDEYRGELDRNRRGVFIYLTNKGQNNLITKNLDCFSSENEDGGVYFPPELSIEIENGRLFLHYGHGRYGYWKYTFRYQNSDFELIGYDSSDNYGPIVNREISINFLTKKKLVRENINKNTEDSGDEIFEETWEDIEINKMYRLSQIKDFDSFEIN
jgi:hypothetical protein